MNITMRSRTLQAIRPLRPAAALAGHHGPLAFARPASSSSSSSPSPPSRAPTPIHRRAPTYIPAARSRPASSRIGPAHPADPVLDPQAAVSPGPSVADIDPSLARTIPTAPDQPGTNGGDACTAAAVDWSSSFHGLSTAPFSAETAALLMQPLRELDVEVKPDGILYLPEIKYRRILNRAFGPGGWGLAPRGDLVVGEKVVTREYALIVHGR